LYVYLITQLRNFSYCPFSVLGVDRSWSNEAILASATPFI